MGTPAWYLDERAHAGPEHLDTDYVQRYETKAGFDPSAEVDALRALGLNDTWTVLDVGAGTGLLALAIAPYVRRVIALDVSPVMVDALRANAARLGLANVDAICDGWLAYQHAGPPVDAIISRHALHHLPDFWKAIALCHVGRLIKPGGLLRLSDLIITSEPAEAETIINGWLAGASADPRIGWTQLELELHLRDEYSTFNWLLEPMLQHAGFTIQSVSVGNPRMYATYTCIRR